MKIFALKSYEPKKGPRIERRQHKGGEKNAKLLPDSRSGRHCPESRVGQHRAGTVRNESSGGETTITTPASKFHPVAVGAGVSRSHVEIDSKGDNEAPKGWRNLRARNMTPKGQSSWRGRVSSLSIKAKFSKDGKINPTFYWRIWKKAEAKTK